MAMLVVLTLGPGVGAAVAQIEIKAAPDVSFRLGILGQFQADTLQDPPDDYSKNLFVRRMRLIFGGQVAKKVSFFVETDSVNLGKTVSGAKNIGSVTIIQDAYGEFKASQAFALDAGLLLVPFSRNGLQGATTLLPIDYGAYTFTPCAAVQALTGRDTGVQARGYLLKDHLEYRVSAVQGARDARSHNGFRYVGRVQYNVFDTETSFFYAGTNLGKKKILAIGSAFDSQDHYQGYDADVFVDMPAGPGALTGQVDYSHFDGDITFTSVPKQNDILLELGYLVLSRRITPVLQYSNRNVAGVTKGDEHRWSIGTNYWWAGHNANVKAAYSRISPPGGTALREFTVQLQIYYY
jgi:hypothetical protein